MVAADPDDAGLDEAAAGPGRERSRAAAEVDDERAVALVLRGEDGGGGAGAGEVVLLGGDFELSGVRGGPCVRHARRGAVDADRTEREQVSAHVLGRGEAVDVVELVADRGELDGLAVGREAHFVGTGVDLGEVFVAHDAAVDRALRDDGLGADLRTRDDEVRLADGVVRLVGEPLQDGLDGIARLGDVDDLALADAGRGDGADGRHAHAPALKRLADGDDGAGRPDFKRGDGIGEVHGGGGPLLLVSVPGGIARVDAAGLP